MVSLNILGNKIGMTQFFDQFGNSHAVTIIKAGPCFVTQIKSIENCGYNAIQLGYLKLSKTSKLLTKPLLGHFDQNNLDPFRYLKEYKVTADITNTIGQEISVKDFKIGQKLNIRGFTIGKGNTGNIKKHHFSRGPMAHGSKHHRLQGSLGSGTTPGRVFPGKKMPGRSGHDYITIKGLELLDIFIAENLLIVKGAVPGKSGNLVSITTNNE